jgi:hypothetical protein
VDMSDRVGGRCSGFSAIFGDSELGIVISFPTPLDASHTVLLQKALFDWACSYCETDDIRAVVVPHPALGKIRAIS